MKFGGTDPEPGGFAADLVQRDQPGVPVEQAVLHRLCGRRAAQLLQARRGFVGRECRGDHVQRFSQLGLTA